MHATFQILEEIFFVLLTYDQFLKMSLQELKRLMLRVNNHDLFRAILDNDHIFDRQRVTGEAIVLPFSYVALIRKDQGQIEVVIILDIFRLNLANPVLHHLFAVSLREGSHIDDKTTG